MQILKKFFRFFLGLIILAGAVGAFLLYRSHTVQKLTEERCVATGGLWAGDSCDCPEFFPSFNKEKLQCEDKFGNFVSSRAEALRFGERKNFAEKCVTAKKEVYVLPGTPLTFCYPHEWGGAKLIEVGDTVQVTFPKPTDTTLGELPVVTLGKKLGFSTTSAAPETIGTHPVLVQTDARIISIFAENSFQDFDFLVVTPESKKSDAYTLIENLWFDDLIQ